MADRLTIVKDSVKKTFKALADLTGKQVLIGIPDDGADRKEGDAANNALIGYVMENGSPAHNVPARPHLVPGVQQSEPQTLPRLKAAANAALDGNAKKSDQHLNEAGIIAANEVRGMINSNLPPPLAPSTIANRHRQRGTKMRESEQVYMDLVAKGVDPGAAQADIGIVALVNTGEYRNSITHVVRKK